MILEIKIKNFLSFKDEVTFSFEATADTTLDEYYVVEPIPGVRVLKMAMVYGANASGKSNLLKVFDFIRFFVQYIPKEKDKKTRFIPFKFDVTCDESGYIELTFFAGNQKHKYILCLDQNKVISEKLYYYPGTRPAVIFERHFDELNQISVIEFGSKIKISEQAKEAIQLKTLRNMSVLAAFSQVNLAVPEMNKPLLWFKEQFLAMIDPYTNLTEYSDKHIKSDENTKKFALNFIRQADLNISNIKFEDEVMEVPDELLKIIEVGPFFTDDEKLRIRKEKTIHREQTMFEHTITKNGLPEQHILNKDEESQGTLRYYGLSAPFFNTIENNSFLSIDEIGSALHPLLVMHFLREFLRKSKQAQLLFTTHNLSILQEKEILRKDAIWFTEKQDDGATIIYSMADFNFRKELSYYNAYKQGKFGAVPNLEGK
jgi:AAA15 family ATPase/GTPase